MDWLTQLGDAPDGIVTGGFAADRGVGPHQLSRLCRRGQLRRVERGVYVLNAVWTSDPLARHHLLTQAVLRSYQGGVAASHHSAATLHGLAVYGCDLSTVRLVRTDVGRRTSRPARAGRTRLIIGDSVPPVHVHDRRGYPTVRPGLAAAQIAMVAGVEAGVVTLDNALHRRLTDTAELERLIEVLAPRAGTPMLRQAVALADGRAESPGESRLRVRLRQLGYPVEPQVRFARAGQVMARVDLYLEEDAVIIEFDGAVKYRTDGDNDGRYELMREKERETELRDDGYEVVRFTWSDLNNLATLRRRVDRAIDRSRRARRAAR